MFYAHVETQLMLNTNAYTKESLYICRTETKRRYRHFRAVQATHLDLKYMQTRTARLTKRIRSCS